MYEEEFRNKTKWLKFYVNWRFPIGFIIGGLYLFGTYSQVIEASHNQLSSIPTLVFVFLSIDVLVYVFRIVVYINMRAMTEKGYHQNNALLFSEVLIIAADSYQASEKNTLFTVIISIFIFLIWFLPNYNYFKKRAFLFT